MKTDSHHSRPHSPESPDNTLWKINFVQTCQIALLFFSNLLTTNGAAISR